MLADIRPPAAGEPVGVLRDYLEHASIAVCLGNTMFVHGALDRSVIGVVPEDGTRFCTPSTPQPFRTVRGGVAECAREMNELMQRGLSDHAARPSWDANRSSRGGEALMALQNRASLSGRCVVSSAYADGGCITSQDAPRRREILSEVQAASPTHDALLYEGWPSDPRCQHVADWLLTSGIRRLVVGHKPSGDSPAVLSARHTGVEVISADTSYADGTSADGRGRSIAGVSLHGPSLDINHARIFGRLADGRLHEAHLPTLPSDDPAFARGDLLVGNELDDGWWVKALLKDDQSKEDGGRGRGVAPADAATGGSNHRVYLCCRGRGRTVEYRDEVRLLPESDPTQILTLAPPGNCGE